MTAIAAPLDLDGIVGDADFAPLEALLGAAPDQRLRDACHALNATVTARLEQQFRADIRSRSLFSEIIRQPRRIGHELERMHRYGVLAAYLPTFARDNKRSRTVMEVVAVDRRGLLSEIGSAMQQCGVSLVDARIATFGARAEDYFYINDSRRRPFSDAAAQERLRTLIVTALT